MKPDVDLIEHIISAHSVALNPRESRIFALRFGLSEEEPLTLGEIGERFGLSRERIRQLLNRTLNKIRGRGRAKIRKGDISDPCAQLILYLEEKIRPFEPGDVDRLLSFIINDLSFLPTNTHALPLVTHLVYQNKSDESSYREEAKWRVQEIRRILRHQHKQQREHKRFEQLLAYVIWPPKIRSQTADQISRIRIQRVVSKDSIGKSGCYFSQKLDREVEYESQLEWDFLLRLEEHQSVVFYQEQPFVVSYEFGHQSYNYHPDILLVLDDGSGIVVEIKPVFKMALHRNLAKWSALRKFCNDKGLGILITDGRRTIQQVQQQEVDAGFAQSVLAALQDGPISWNEYREIKEKHNVDRNAFLALVLRKRLIWELSPFRLILPC